MSDLVQLIKEHKENTFEKWWEDNQDLINDTGMSTTSIARMAFNEGFEFCLEWLKTILGIVK